MSLISDALKKARQEAARQDAAQRGLPYAVGGAEAARRNGLAGPLVAGLAAGAVLVGAGALAAYLGHWGPWREPGGERLAQAPPAVPAAAPQRVGTAPVPPAFSLPPPSPEISPASPAGALPAGGELGGGAGDRGDRNDGNDRSDRLDQSPRSAPGAPSIDLRPATPPASVPAQTQPPASSSAPVRPAPTPVQAPAPAPPAPRAAPPSGETAPAEGGEERVYAGEVPVPGGGTLRLSGIAFSDNPVAVIDGKIVGRGEVVQGYTIVEIQRGRVRLQGYGQNLVLTVR